MSTQSSLLDPHNAAFDAESTATGQPASGRAERRAWEHEEILNRLSAQFQIVREVGRGGMGVVFLARDVALHRLVAIKVLRHEFTSSEAHRERFRREARTTARLNHPNIVPVHTFGEIEEGDGGPLSYIVMKYVHGESLASRLQREGTLPADEARRILRELARALHSAHRDGVVHRDLKPENILLERSTGRAMLTDFGVALLRSLDPVRAESARAFGTPHYMSPEQAAGELDIDHRSDLYSIGVLGYYMLTGALPFDGPTFEALAARHIAEAHVPLAELRSDLPEPLTAAIERCLHKDREARWNTAADLADALADPRPRRSWFGGTAKGSRGLFGVRRVAGLTMLAAALSAAVRWTML